jgi:hypothetical protein
MCTMDLAEIALGLEAALDEIDSGELEATPSQRAFLEGAFRTVIQLKDANS